MLLPLSPDEVLSTTRSVRKRLDFSRDVPLDVLRECLELALQAPTGSLRQDWHFVVSNDREQCRRVGEVYKRTWLELVGQGYRERTLSKETDDRSRRAFGRMIDSARYLAEHFPEVPAVLVPCIDGRLDGAPATLQALKWGSIIQAAWSFMLAARVRGLGTCWTTVHLTAEKEVAEILGIPHESVQQVALIPIAYTHGTEFKPGERKPFEQFVHLNRW